MTGYDAEVDFWGDSVPTEKLTVEGVRERLEIAGLGHISITDEYIERALDNINDDKSGIDSGCYLAIYEDYLWIVLELVDYWIEEHRGYFKDLTNLEILDLVSRGYVGNFEEVYLHALGHGLDDDDFRRLNFIERYFKEKLFSLVINGNNSTIEFIINLVSKPSNWDSPIIKALNIGKYSSYAQMILRRVSDTRDDDYITIDLPNETMQNYRKVWSANPNHEEHFLHQVYEACDALQIHSTFSEILVKSPTEQITVA